MANRYGLTEAQRTLSTQPFDMWSGAFMSTWEASGVARTGARSVTMTTYNGEKLKVYLPAGITFPRTEDNYRDIDAALSDALSAHYLQAREAPSHLPDSALDPAPEGWEDYELVNDAQHAAHMRAVCPHDDVEGDDNVPTNYTCRTCGDVWNGGAE